MKGEDDRDISEKCEGEGETPSNRCEWKVPRLALEDGRDAWGVYERNLEMVGWRKGFENLDGVPLGDAIRSGVSISEGRLDDVECVPSDNTSGS